MSSEKKLRFRIRKGDFEIELEGDVERLFGGGIGRVALHAQADIVEYFAVEGDLRFDEGIFKRREIGGEALAFEVFLGGWTCARRVVEEAG